MSREPYDALDLAMTLKSHVKVAHKFSKRNYIYASPDKTDTLYVAVMYKNVRAVIKK